jgi:predicted  nucleic acid-binding Zn-ribbon protein
MSVAKQLYQLQEIDLEIEANEQALRQIASQLGESQALVKTQTKLASEKQRLEELKQQQQSWEWEIDDLVSKLTAVQERLYGGSIKNPKELSSLQHEVEGFKSKREQLEDKALEIMEQVELTEASVATKSNEFKELEAEWQSQQQQLSGNMEELKTTLADLQHKREALSTSIDPEKIELYNKLKKQKGTAIAKVEQGICRGCRISLSAAELQQARGGNSVQCSNCGRILFLA